MQGTRVKKKDLKKFLDFVREICPWFPQEGTIDENLGSELVITLKTIMRHWGL